MGKLKKKPVIILVSVIVLIIVSIAAVIKSTNNKKQIEAAAGISQEETEQGEDINESEDKDTEEKETENVAEEYTLPEVTTEAEVGGQGEYPGKKKVYLTFDDGPSANTGKILDILDEYGVKATFFTICNTRPRDIENMQRIVESGNTIAIHSVSHEYSQIYSSLDSFKGDVLDMQQYIYDQTGYETWIYRFPGGSSNSRANCDIEECKSFLKDEGFTYFDWNVDSGDASDNNVPKDIIVRNVLSGIGDEEEYVVLMHDAAAKATTVEALPEIIEGLQERGYEILPITKDTKPIHH